MTAYIGGIVARGNKKAVAGNEYSDSLQAANNPQRSIYTFEYDPADDSWDFFNVQHL
jgi:hypothetical protein